MKIKFGFSSVVGDSVGDGLGLLDGFELSDGDADGLVVIDGWLVGSEVGLADGRELDVGTMVGVSDGEDVGIEETEGTFDGAILVDGAIDGCCEM